MMGRSVLALLLVVAPIVVLAASSLSSVTIDAAPAPLGLVRYVDHGLTVQPPSRKPERGTVKMPLYNRYFLRTGANQRASIGFHDGTVLHINRRTDLILENPHLTRVNRGEVEEILRPGTRHMVETPAAVAAAIGTKFDVREQGRVAEIVVVTGVVEVSNKKGRVFVKKNHETTVKLGAAPAKPVQVDAGKVVGWSKGIPTPNLGENLALDANGGHVVAESSQRSGFEAGHIDDGRLDTSWETASGAVGKQSITVGFEGNRTYDVSGILLDGAASGGASPQTDLKDFEIQVSTNSANDSDFHSIATSQTPALKQANVLQPFSFAPQPVRYLRLVLKDNYGSADGISVAELEVVGRRATGPIFNQPIGVAIDPKGDVDVAELTIGIQRVSPEGRLLATIGAIGRDPGENGDVSGDAVDRNGNIYAVDGRGRVLKYSPNGSFLRQWGSPGTAPGQFAAPNGIATDAAGNVYVADTNNTRIQKFSPNGQFLAEFDGKLYGPALFNGFPYGIAVDAQGNMYLTVADSVVKLSPNGQRLAQWGSSGKGNGQFIGAQGIALDAQGNIYVADAQNKRIQKLSPQGNFLAAWTTPGVNSGPPVLPLYLAVDASGFVYVSSGAHGGVVQKFSPTGRLVATWH